MSRPAGGACRLALPKPVAGNFLLKDVCWPGEQAFGGRLLVSAIHRGDVSGPDRYPQLWWIRLGPDGTAVVAAGLVFDPREAGPRGDWREVRLPAVGLVDGRPLLAYLARSQEEAGFELWVTTIGADASEGRSTALARTGRKLSESCEPLEPAFSADGRWLYAVVSAGRAGEFHVERFAVSRGAARSKTRSQTPRDTACESARRPRGRCEPACSPRPIRSASEDAAPGCPPGVPR